ncbi:Gamma-glutamyl hydrolase [Larimichthys crocea]|uniref:folate gamma-glutamyl hydrolase n=1 Tax=Larimichthys crocea TaxID=215358 RepID=A0A6G0HKS2_LARCR|nr:Gamma-glutamyl hydrolase [Larimichthys crocea]
MTSLSFCVFLLCLPFYSSASTNDRPIIGVLAQDLRTPRENYTSYIAASYVKFLEAAGARVVPVMINKTAEEYKTLFNSINGILYPGGSASIVSSGYQRAAKIFYEWLLRLLLTRTNTTAVALPLDFTDEAKGSRIFKGFPAELMEDLASEPLTDNSHKWSVSMLTYNTTEELKNFYKVLSTNTDGDTEFVSTMEAYDYPIYGTQWHPEKNAFEWKKPHYPHSPSAIKTTFYTGRFFCQ